MKEISLPNQDGLPPYMIMPTFEKPVKQEFSFTPKQRLWWLGAYDFQCAFPLYDERRGYYRCSIKGANKLQIHHIVPTSWQNYHDPEQDPNETLGIALCKSHHDDVIHPDIGEALRGYYQDHDAIKNALHAHREKVRKGEVFWNNSWDELFMEIAERAKKEYLQVTPYPHDVSWEKKYHPKKKHWWNFLDEEDK